MPWISHAGWCLLAAWTVTLVTWGVVRPDPYAQGWRLVLELAFLGRLVSIADGVASGFSPTYLLIQSGTQDVVLLLIVYPWAVAAYQGSSRRGLLSGSVDRVRRTAERHRKVVEPLGVIGLWVFVFFPFWSTGALVGGVVGYLLGMRTWTVFLAVFSGHVVSVVSLVWFLDSARVVMEAFNTGLVRFLPWMVLGLLVLMGFVGRAIGAYRRHRSR